MLQHLPGLLGVRSPWLLLRDTQFPPATVGSCGLHSAVLLPSLLAPGLVPAGVFLHSTAMRTFGVCWPGPWPRGAAALEMLLGGQPLFCGALQKDFQVVPSFPILRLPVPSNWRRAPLSSFAMSQPWRFSKPGKICIRQLPDKPAAVPFDVLQTPVVNSADPQLSSSAPCAHPALRWGREGLLHPALDTLALGRGFVVGSCSMLTPWRGKDKARSQDKEAKAGFVNPTPVAHLVLPSLGAVNPSCRLCSQPAAGEGARLGLARRPLWIREREESPARHGAAGVRARKESAVPGVGRGRGCTPWSRTSPLIHPVLEGQSCSGRSCTIQPP